MSAENFLDSNLFVYHIEKLDMAKFHIANEHIRAGIERGAACISFQVIQEVLNTAIHKSEISFSTNDAREYMDTILAPLYTVPSSVDLYHRAIGLQGRYQFAFYDALIVAAALRAGCTRLLTEDMQHGQEVEGLVIENPFL